MFKSHLKQGWPEGENFLLRWKIFLPISTCLLISLSIVFFFFRIKRFAPSTLLFETSLTIGGSLLGLAIVASLILICVFFKKANDLNYQFIYRLDILRRFHFNRAEFNLALFHQFDQDEEFQMQIINALPNAAALGSALDECRHNENLARRILERMHAEASRLFDTPEPNHDHDDDRGGLI
jgi:hypothetical protein